RQQGSRLYELNAALDLARETGDVAELADALTRFPESASFAALDDARELASRS
ncbi:MAG: hypothetical protein QOF21_1537, partial [Actinomycetota bacterium]